MMQAAPIPIHCLKLFTGNKEKVRKLDIEGILRASTPPITYKYVWTTPEENYGFIEFNDKINMQACREILRAHNYTVKPDVLYAPNTCGGALLASLVQLALPFASWLYGIK